jgi:hypothetical protein
LLDTSGPGTNALAVSQPVASSGAVTNTTGGWPGAIITPDGRTVLIVAEFAPKDGQVRERLLKVSTATGKATAILSNLNIGREQVLYTNATGSVLVVSYAGPGVSAANARILRGDTYTPLPWTATTLTAAW